MAAAGPLPDRWDTLRAQDLRVAEIGYRLSVASTALCPGSVARPLGFVLHSLQQYDAADRDAVARSFGLGSHIGVMAVVPGSPAQRSGLAANDQLVSVNARPLTAAIAASNAGSARASVEAALRIVAEEMAKGPVILGVLRSGAPHSVEFSADLGCGSSIELMTGDEVNAWSDGKRVVVSEALVSRSRTDGNLALVIGHELAHNFLRHSERLAPEGSASHRLQLAGTGSSENREMEEEADRLAVWIVRAAAYDLSDALSFVTELLEVDSPSGTADTHPETGRRLALLKAEIASASANRAPPR